MWYRVTVTLVLEDVVDALDEKDARDAVEWLFKENTRSVKHNYLPAPEITVEPTTAPRLAVQGAEGA